MSYNTSNGLGGKVLEKLKNDLRFCGNEERKQKVMRYFKTGKGQYGEGDIFLGITNPDLRKCLKPYQNDLSLEDIESLLKSPEHEFRLAALLLMVYRFRRNTEEREKIANLYINNTDYVNNWDLVDSSAHTLLGPWLEDKDRSLLYEFAKSDHLWKQRISIMTTFDYIKKNRDFKDTLAIAEILLNHTHDLIHKAVGWMLREIGNVSLQTEEEFLKKHYKNMPRTMLRYAIEKFPKDKYQDYLKGRI